MEDSSTQGPNRSPREELGQSAEGARTSELVRRAEAGDRRALEEMLSAHVARLRGYIRLRMGPRVRSKESSEDLVQSVCREALERLDEFEFRGESSFRNWLFRTAEHKVVDRGRFYTRDKRDAARERSVHAGAEDGDTLRGLESLFTPSRDAAAHEELERLAEAFAQLPPDYQEVILLARVVGLPHAEIAERMGKSVSATWTLLSRALARLAFRLGE